MRISDWSSDVCSSDLLAGVALHAPERHDITIEREHDLALRRHVIAGRRHAQQLQVTRPRRHRRNRETCTRDRAQRSEEHTSELQSLMRISYAVFCLKKKNKANKQSQTSHTKYHNHYIKAMNTCTPNEQQIKDR